MPPYIMTRVRNILVKTLGLPSEAEEFRRERFKQLAGEDWNSPPDRFCREEKKIDPKLIGRFYGENNLKKCALEIRRIGDGRLVLRCAYKTRTRATWPDKSQATSLNGYFSLMVRGEKIGSKKGLNFRKNPDGKFFLGYKNHMEVVMKKV